jgi:glycosyltransferase involved in cell wall biosynthesis
VSEPKVSVVIPTFNRSTFLRQAMTSVLAQRYSDFELIVSDNASTDDTPAMVTGWMDGRIRHFRNDRNLGMAPNWNAGMRHARGEYVALLEDDNWWHPEYLARTVDTLDRHPDIAFVHTGLHLTDAQGKVMQVFRRWGSDRICDKKTELITLLQGNKIFLSTVTARRAIIETVGLFDEAIPFAPDWDLWLRVYMHHDGAFVAEPLVFYRQHDANLSKQFLAQPATLLADHQYVLEKTLGRIGDLYGPGFARQARKLSSRWLGRWKADIQVHRAWATLLEGRSRQAREEAALALHWDPFVTLRFPFRLLVIALPDLGPQGSGRSIAALEERLGRWLARCLPSVFRAFF